MPSKLEQLKKEIQRLRPEIMELKFGCEILLNGFSDVEKSIITTVSLSLINTIDYIVDAEDDWWCNGQYKKEDIREILGRPITFEDVLFCCIEAYSKFGIITKKSYEEMLGGVVGLWDFTKDFDNQKEEFYDEIMFLLQ